MGGSCVDQGFHSLVALTLRTADFDCNAECTHLGALARIQLESGTLTLLVGPAGIEPATNRL